MYRLNAAQTEIVERARRVADEGIAPHAARVDAESAFPAESVRALAAAGFLGLNVPAPFGGMGQGPRVMAGVLDEIAQRCASTAMIYKMHLCGIACYAAAGDRFARELRLAAEGRHLSTLAWSEKGSRSHFWAPVSQARRENGVILLDAEKSWVTSAGHADGYVVSTRRVGAESPTDTSLYLVLREDGGFEVSGPWNGLGMRGNASSPVRYRNCAVKPERALSEEGKGFDTMLGVVLPIFQLGNAAISVGIAEAAVAATQSHLTGSRFQHLGSTLADLPNLRARLADMRIATDRARAHLAGVLESVENPGPATMLHVLGIKAAAAETAAQVTETGMRACGGAAFSRHLGLERNFRDARAALVMAPTTDQIHEFVGRALCGMELM